MLKLNNIKDFASQKKSKRVGRGIGSGKGKTSGAGHKGQKSRSGVSIKGFEGGQMPLHRRLPKRGFKNPFRKKFSIVNIEQIATAIKEKKIDAKKNIDNKVLFKAGLIRKENEKVKLLGNGKTIHQLVITVSKASKKAIAIIGEAKGKIETIQDLKSKKEIETKEPKKIEQKEKTNNTGKK
tara:strand:- start:998 stop:1540 length:543 start_codon:yes stop_codon:yes gene_type:complete